MAAPMDNEISPPISENTATASRRTVVHAREPEGNRFQRCVDFIDENLRLFRTGVTVTAALGVLLIARSIRVYQRFQSVSDIPEEFVRKNVKLYGRFIEVKEDPVHIVVRHTPILDLQKWPRKQDRDGLSGLPVHLAGLELQDGCKEYLRGRLTAQVTLRFHVLDVNKENGLDCIVDLVQWKFPFRRTSLNEELLSQGLAKVTPLPGLLDQRLQTRLTQQLLAAELRAEKKSRGVWLQEREPSRLAVAKDRLARAGAALASGVTVLGKFATLPWRAIRDLQGIWRRQRDRDS
ncbi:protein C3orf33-like [Acanthaster planci]|uniref:Protein C3orf33-like n=1 Tax=Acanthaster planci TaxID=133434 RepID=A0A8B7Y0J6_ACAPL|nr:protein C3orf33-like [Acanthaster planci]